MENRNELAVYTELTRAAGRSRATGGARHGQKLAGRPEHDRRRQRLRHHDFVMELRELSITPHVAQNAYDAGTARRRSAIDGRTARHDGYAVSQKKRKRIEEIFGWLKTIGGLRQTRFRGLD